ncbi:hypothetical protein ACFQZ1_08940 [Bacillus sp. CGMCC 1.60114]|uniref:hypothetical protein n=1 Tax=unclassified Bacillus (in: firmicutes) TaxID=185979 RepID=UPI00363498AA
MLKENPKYKGHWRRFIIFTCIVGLIVGIFSVISDNIQYLDDGITVLEFVISYLAVMLNSLPVWFILAMLVGYIFAKDIKNAVLLGAIYTITAITFYFVIGHFYEDVSPITISFKEQAIAYMTWYVASTIGGILGGGVGFLIKKTPYALLSLLIGLILQLFVNGVNSWRGIVGISQNVTFCLMIVSIVIYLVVVRFKKTRRTDVVM